ncbi:RCC1/BLIP-II [Ramaria rubella]|nr:RCC1/BLIP-II [Ramaria rubella]
MSARSSFKLGTRLYSTAKVHAASKSRRAQIAVAASSTVTIGVSLYVLSQGPVYNDASTVVTASTTKQQLKVVGFSPLAWGSNINRIISPERDSGDCIKFPTYIPDLLSSPLRDLTIGNNHAACVDASGDVYQWGDGFFGSEPAESRRPRLTLQGMNIISLAITPNKVFALSTTGKIYVLSSSLTRQLSGASSSKSIWNVFGTSNVQPFYTVLDTDVPLAWGERFTSISAGTDHLLALTSAGRTFAHPVTRFANWYGQLGVRKITVQDPSESTKRLSIELLPKPTRDNFRGKESSALDVHRSITEPSAPLNDQTIEFCNRLFEIPTLHNLVVKQVVAGDRTSFIVTHHEGRVLGWGANEFGQLGLGANVTLPSVVVPTEVVLNNFTERGTTNRCTDISAGGDLTFFTVERALPAGKASIVDVLGCGNGQWGGLGNASYSNAQGTLVKVKNISGVLEYDEKSNSLKPLKPHCISVASGPDLNNSEMRHSSSGHIIVTLDTIPLSHPSPNSNVATEAAGSPGRDVLTWGLNQHYQLGNGKRASVNIPTPVQAGDGEGRLMCKVSKGKVKDFKDRLVGRKMDIEQCAVAGPGISVIYWRIVQAKK